MSGAGESFALYISIWMSVILFVIGEAGQRASLRGGPEPRWAWPLWAVGAALCAAHIVMATAVRYGWNHDAAVRATAQQTHAVYGVRWGGGVYVNYVFAGVWLAEVLWWRADPRGYFGRPLGVTRLIRAFYLVILVNAAIVFASPSRRPGGLILIALLLWLWRPTTALHRSA